MAVCSPLPHLSALPMNQPLAAESVFAAPGSWFWGLMRPGEGSRKWLGCHRCFISLRACLPSCAIIEELRFLPGKDGGRCHQEDPRATSRLHQEVAIGAWRALYVRKPCTGCLWPRWRTTVLPRAPDGLVPGDPILEVSSELLSRSQLPSAHVSGFLPSQVTWGGGGAQPLLASPLGVECSPDPLWVSIREAGISGILGPSLGIGGDALRLAAVGPGWRRHPSHWVSCWMGEAGCRC